MTGTGARAAGMDTPITANRFLAWLADDANPALTRLIQAWLWQPGSDRPRILPASVVMRADVSRQGVKARVR